MISDHQEQKNAEMLFGVLGLLLLSVFPLAARDYSSITRFKYLQMLFLTCICTAAALASFRSWKDAFTWKRLSLWICAGFALWTALSAFLGSYASVRDSSGMRVCLTGAVRYEGLVTQLCYVLLFFVFSLHRPHAGMILHACGIAVSVYAAVVLCQYAGWNVLDLYPKGRSTLSNYEFQGTIGNIDMVSGYLTLMIPILLVSYVQGLGGKRILLSGLAGVFLEALMEVQSGLLALAVLSAVLLTLFLMSSAVRLRAFAALAGICACFAARSVIALPWLDGVESVSFLWNWKAAVWLLPAVLSGLLLAKKPSFRVSGRTVILMWAVFLTLSFLLVCFAPLTEADGMLWEVQEILHGRGSDSFGSWRWGVWRHTLAVSRGQLAFGAGPDMFYYAMKDYLKATGTVLGENFDNPHNMYLAILAGSGLPALLLYLALLVSLMRSCLRSRDPFGRALGMGILLYSIQGFFSFSICLVSPMVWTVFGMACAGEEKSTRRLNA